MRGTHASSHPIYLFLFAILLSLLSITYAHESGSATLFHDQSPLLEVEELTEMSSAVLDEKTRWGLSDNMAHYLGLKRLLSFSIPVHVNLIFIGFQGDGNGYLVLNQGDYAAWFEHLEHELEHVVAPVGEMQTTTDENETPDSSVKYRFLVDVLQLSPLVNTIVEDTIVWGLAEEEPPEADEHLPGDHKDTRGELHYADAMRMSSLLRDLLMHLNLSNSYTFFILNPKSPVGAEETYGYRYGFSDEDIEVISEHAKELRIEWPPTPSAPRKSNHTSDVISKLQFRDLFAESEKWATEYIAIFREATELVDCSSPEWSDHIRCRAQRGNGRSVLERADYIAHYGTLEEKLYLQRIINGAPLNEQCLVDVWISRDRFAFIDLTAGPFSWGPNVAGEGVRTEDSLPRIPLGTVGGAVAYPGAKIDNTELGEAFAAYKAHCSMIHPESNPDDKTTAYCNELKSKIVRLEEETKKLRESWAAELAGSEEEGSIDPIDAIEQVMWRLSATLANGVRALLAPPSGLYSTPLTSRIAFQAILVRSPGVSYKPEEWLRWPAFKEQIQALRLPGQEFSFTFSEQELSLASDLSMAFRLSLRTHVIPTLNTGGNFKATAQTFVDSIQFRELLGVRNLVTSADVPVPSNATGTDLRYRTVLVQRTIPIYIFAVGTEFGPLLVDRYYQAKSLSDMVVAVMSDYEEYESRLSCNEEPIYWDLKDPVKALLSASALTLGGLVPLHVGYNHPRHRTTQDWLWSVGDSPLSHTSSGIRFNQLQQDLVHRNYVRQHVDSALELAEEAISWLAEEATEDSDFESVAPAMSVYWTELRVLYSVITRTLGELGHEAAHLDFAMAAPLIPKLDGAVASFHALAEHVSSMSHLLRCTARTTAATKKVSRSINWGVIGALVMLDASVVAMALLALSRKRKLKIN